MDPMDPVPWEDALPVTGTPGVEVEPFVERRPAPGQLRELRHEKEQTLWWIAVERGVHYSLVTRWCYEADVPLLRRSFTDETFREIREYRGE